MRAILDEAGDAKMWSVRIWGRCAEGERRRKDTSVLAILDRLVVRRESGMLEGRGLLLPD